MNHSHFVTEFTIERVQKSTPSTVSPINTFSSGCSYCKEHLGKVSELRKKEIMLQLRNEELKQEVDHLKRQRDELINQRVMTYNEYQQRLQSNDGWNRQDLQAQLFEAKIIIQLLLTSKAMPNHPQIKEQDSEGLRKKYSDLLLQNLRLQEKVMIKDRIIEEKVFFPIYHYDQRVSTLRKAMVHWYRKSQEECIRMKKRCKDLKQNLNQQVQNMRQAMNSELDQYRNNLSTLIVVDKKKLPKQQKKQRKQQKQTKNRIQKDNLMKAQSKKLR